MSLAADQGPCIYYYGNTGGALYYQSPNGTFTTPKLGTVKIAKKAMVTGSKITLGVTDSSAYKASGTIDLTVGGKLAGTAKFSLQPSAKGTAKVNLTAKGRTALGKGQTVKSRSGLSDRECDLDLQLGSDVVGQVGQALGQSSTCSQLSGGAAGCRASHLL